METFLDSRTTLIPGNAVAAILSVDDGRYLMQLRDIRPDIFFPGHWGCFGGAIEPGESEIETLSRELQEELGHSIDTATAEYFTRLHFDFGFAGHGTISRTYFEIRISVELIPRLVLGEGQDMRLLSLEALLSNELTTPYDAHTLWMHGQRSRLKRNGSLPETTPHPGP